MKFNHIIHQTLVRILAFCNIHPIIQTPPKQHKSSLLAPVTILPRSYPDKVDESKKIPSTFSAGGMVVNKTFEDYNITLKNKISSEFANIMPGHPLVG